MDVWLLLRQFHVQEDDDASDVVDDVVLLLLPFEIGFSDDCLGSFLRIFALVVGENNFGDVVVAEELPDAVACQDDESVFGAQV